jgi:hypothetical protein
VHFRADLDEGGRLAAQAEVTADDAALPWVETTERGTKVARPRRGE